jgi:DNA-directed RNA polymerase subunit F
MAVQTMKAVSELYAVELVKDKVEKSKIEADYNEQLLIEHGKVLETVKASEGYVKKLVSAGLPEEAAIKVADVMPRHKDTIKLLLLQFNVQADDNLMGEILKITGGE